MAAFRVAVLGAAALAPLFPSTADGFVPRASKFDGRCSTKRHSADAVGYIAGPRRRPRAAASPLSLLASIGGDSDIAGEDGIGGETGDNGRDMVSLQEWAFSRGFQLAEGAKLVSEDGSGWGVSLDRSTPAGTAVMRVPKSIVLSSADEESSSSADGKVLSDGDLDVARSIVKERGMEEHWTEFLLVTRILAEKAKGAESEWHPWLESLPRTFTTGLFMDEVERSYLPALAAGLVELQDRQLEAFDEALRSVQNEDVRAALSGAPDGGDDLIRWAFSVVFTRSHRFRANDGSGECEPRTEIVPMGDIFNHREPGDVVWNDDVEDGYAEFVLKEDVALEEGETSRDIYLSYGLSNPHRFLAIFGFVDERTPEVLSQVVFTDPAPEMVELGCNDPRRMVFSSGGMIANAVWDSLLYAILAGRPDEQRALYDAHVKGDREAKGAVHSRYALEVSMALKRHVEQALEGAYSEEKTVVVAVPSVEGGPSERPILPLVCSLNSLMRTIFTRVKLRLDCIVEQEYRRRAAQHQQRR